MKAPFLFAATQIVKTNKGKVEKPEPGDDSIEKAVSLLNELVKTKGDKSEVMREKGTPDTIEALLKGACDQKNQKGCLLLGFFDIDREKYEEAENLLKKPCLDGIGQACYALGTCFLNRKNMGDAKEAFQKGCDGGLSSSCESLGNLLFEEESFQEASKYLQRTCNGTTRSGCNRLAKCYEKLDRPLDAKKVYQESCTAKDAASCSDLGLLIEMTEKKEVEASRYYDLACSMRNDTGCHNYAVFLEEAKHDMVASNDLLKKVCARKYALSCHRLADNMRETRKFKEANAYLKKACDYEREEACEEQRDAESLPKEICDNVLAIRALEGRMTKEGRIGAKSGFVNKETMYWSGKRVVDLEDELKPLEEAYLKFNGGRFNRNTCRAEAEE
jgi:TPR repeat protein